MTAELVTTAEAGSPEWHEHRTRGLGGSEIAAVVGLSPYESPFSLWHRKKGNIPPVVASEPMLWGNVHEPAIADHFAARHPELVVSVAGTYRNTNHPWQLANVDRLLHRDTTDQPTALLEVKTSRFGEGFGATGTDQIPIHYRAQVIHYMDVLGLPHAWVAVLIGGNEFREYVIDYDAADAAALREAGAAFWASLQTDDEPPIDASFDTYTAVKALHPHIDDTDVPIDPALHVRYLATKQDADSATAAHRQAKSELLAAMGKARRALVNEVPVLRRQPGRNGSVSLYPVREAS